MVKDKLRFTRGTLVVFEGLDKAGKSTQINALESATWAGVQPLFVHMPSGLNDSTRKIYGALEGGSFSSGLAKQLFHMACHAENVAAIQVARTESAVVLDRFWWSTIAYGWYEGRLWQTGMHEESFLNVISAIWSNLDPNLIFLFLDPQEDDDNNTDEVRTGYLSLAKKFSEKTVLVPTMSIEETNRFVVEKIEASGLLARVTSSQAPGTTITAR